MAGIQQQKRVTLDEIWGDLEAGVYHLITNLNQGLEPKKWMELYSYPFSIWSFCWDQIEKRTLTLIGAYITIAQLLDQLRLHPATGTTNPPEPILLDKIFITSSKNFLQSTWRLSLRYTLFFSNSFVFRQSDLLWQVAETRVDEGLLHYYHVEWTRYVTAMKYINHIFQYLVSTLLFARFYIL